MDFSELNFDVSVEVQELVPEHRLASIINMFTQIDADHDGKISLDEFLDFYLAEKKAALTKSFEYMDLDKDGFIEFDEFVLVKEPNFHILKKFRELDLEHNGMLTIEEAVSVAEQLNLPLDTDQVKAIIHKVDRDGDGQVTYYEYLGAITHIGFQ